MKCNGRLNSELGARKFFCVTTSLRKDREGWSIYQQNLSPHFLLLLNNCTGERERGGDSREGDILARQH